MFRQKYIDNKSKEVGVLINGIIQYWSKCKISDSWKYVWSHCQTCYVLHIGERGCGCVELWRFTVWITILGAQCGANEVLCAKFVDFDNAWRGSTKVLDHALNEPRHGRRLPWTKQQKQ